MSYYCFSCGKELTDFSTRRATDFSRRDQCTYCSQDLHSCKSCKFYDPSAYNECHETQAERILEKEQANYCDYFEFGSGARSSDSTLSNREKHLQDLDNLFK